MSPKQTSSKLLPVTRRSAKRRSEKKVTLNDVKSTHPMLTRRKLNEKLNEKIFLRVVMMINVVGLDASYITEASENLHKTIGVVTLTNEQFEVLKPILKVWLESKKKDIKNVFKNQVKATNLVHDGDYSLLKFPDESKIPLDKLTIEFLNFLKENGCLTQGTRDTIPNWVLNKRDPERTERINLHLTYGSGNVPPWMSHHVTIDYGNTNPDGVKGVEALLICVSLGVYTTNHKGQLVDLILTIPL